MIQLKHDRSAGARGLRVAAFYRHAAPLERKTCIDILPQSANMFLIRTMIMESDTHVAPPR